MECPACGRNCKTHRTRKYQFLTTRVMKCLGCRGTFPTRENKSGPFKPQRVTNDTDLCLKRQKA